MDDTKKLRAAMIAAGWRYRQGSGHEVWYCPCGRHMMPVRRGPHKGTRAGMQKLATDLRRVERCGAKGASDAVA